MRPDHPVLHSPLTVRNTNGGLVVLKRKGQGQENQGEALSLDTIVNSCDAELVAKGTSDKGPNRGAIVRHGPYTLWGYAGGVEEMTRSGRELFVNTVWFAAAQADQAVLERRRNMTRYGFAPYLESAGLVDTMRQYIPEDLGTASKEQIEEWIAQNRPYLHVVGRRFHVDEFARSQGIPNHRRAFLERCIACLSDESLAHDALESLERYTGQALGPSAAAWSDWYQANADSLFFSDCDGTRFLVDEEAKAKGVPFEELRGWSSEELTAPGG